ncbi:MAG: hypothetical protein HY705_04340 [Gemmatimonadetes bacterium]|nr:hypothetical protein [Gemmatimonadota bacterium]
MRERSRFVLPRGRRLAWRWIAVSLLAHTVLLGSFLRFGGPLRGRVPQRSLHYLLDLRGRPLALDRSVPIVELPPLARRGAPLVLGRRGAAPDSVRVGPVGVTAGDSEAVSPTGRRAGRELAALTPRRGDGRLWVRPLIIPEGGSRPISLDSVVAVRMHAMADSIERHPMADPSANPYVSRPWTFEAGGRTYGLDARGLHLGTFTIPTAALALIAFPQGTIDQARAGAALMAMRADMLRAAARAEAEDDFKRAVRAIRDRRDRERRDQRERDAKRQPVTP